MQVDIETAEKRLLELVEAAAAGEEVIIATAEGSLVRLVKVVPSPSKKYRLGGLEGVMPPPPDSFFDSLGEEELREWE